ncbi:MAG: metal ABC transporter permease [Firmicutes bacterium]|nr:metal ABC transporter permease [Bacillota bacterium]
MIDIFAFSFMRTGLIAAIISGICCSLIGVFVVLRGMSYVGSGIAHGCLAGVALAFLMGWNPLITSAGVALAMVVIIEILRRRTSLKVDSAIGVTFSLAMALAVLFIGLLRRYTPDIMGYLFGNLLGVTPTGLWIMGGVSVLVILTLLLFFKEFQFSTFDPEMAEVSGIPESLISLILSILMGLTIVVSLQAVGELLVLALIVLPASIARQLTYSLPKLAWYSVGIGVVSAVAGLILSFYLDIPSGSTIVLILGLLFFLSLFFRKKS